jgi:hypothetical protein
MASDAVTFVSYQQYVVELSMAMLWPCNVFALCGNVFILLPSSSAVSGSALPYQQLAIMFNMVNGAVTFW